MLVEFSDGRTLPTSSRLGAGRMLGNERGIGLLDVISDGRTRALEVESPLQLIREEGIVERFGKRENLLKKIRHRFWPEFLVVAAGKLRHKNSLVFQPFGAQAVEMSPPDLQALASCGRIHLPSVKQFQNLTKQRAFYTMGQLTFSPRTVARTTWGRCPQTPEVFRIGNKG